MPQTWNNIVVVKDKPACEVAQSMIENGQKEPFYIFDFDAAFDNVQKFREKLPRVQIFYAMKSNDYSMITKLAIALGLGFDCASPGEINKIRKHDVNPMSIIYAIPVKTPEQMVFAQKSGVRHTTFDSLCELKKLSQYWPDSRLLVRIKLESDSIYKLGDKFGCDYEEAVRLLDEAAQLSMIVIGVAFHVGSICFTEQSYTEGLRISRALFEHEARAGRKMTLLDIGGGFFDDGNNSFDKVTDLINTGLAKWFPEPDIQIVAEPGRYICESAFTLYSNIRDVRTVYDTNKAVNMVYLSNGTNGSLKFIEKWHTMLKFKKRTDFWLPERPTQHTVIWGPTPDDKDVMWPVQLAPCSVDDWLIFYNQGAYCAVFTSEFCSMEKMFTQSVMSDKLWLNLKNDSVFSSVNFMMDSATPPLLLSTLPPLDLGNEKNAKKESDYVIDFKSYVSPAFVVQHESCGDVARAMICGGRQAQPFYTCSLDEAAARVSHFQHMMPRVQIFYAMKANDTSMMLRLALALGLGISCASPGEIHKIRKVNVNETNIIFNMLCKSDEEMEYARQVGVKHTTFDSSNELKKIKRSWPDAQLLIRIKIDDMSKQKLGSKYGCGFEEATSLLNKAASLDLNVVGVAFHVGSMYSPASYVEGLKLAHALFEHEASRGRRMTIVDIGGGFLSHATHSIDEVSYLINDTLEDMFPDQTVQVIAEPGRYLCDSAFKMFCSVVGERKIFRDNVPVNMLYLDNGVYGTMRSHEKRHTIKKFQRTTEVEPILEEATILWGPTGDSLDRVMQDSQVQLPRCSPGDWLELDIHGAFTFTFSTRFSCLEIPLIRPVVSQELWYTLRQSASFRSTDFMPNPDLSAPLHCALPPILPLPTTDIYKHSNIPTLNID